MSLRGWPMRRKLQGQLRLLKAQLFLCLLLQRNHVLRHPQHHRSGSASDRAQTKLLASARRADAFKCIVIALPRERSAMAVRVQTAKMTAFITTMFLRPSSASKPTIPMLLSKRSYPKDKLSFILRDAIARTPIVSSDIANAMPQVFSALRSASVLHVTMASLPGTWMGRARSRAVLPPIHPRLRGRLQLEKF